MRAIPPPYLICRPESVRRAALSQSDLTALVLSCVNGIAGTAAVALLFSPPMTVTLVMVLALLFGPLAGFTASSVHTLIDVAAGRLLGSKASYHDLYRLFSWSFLSLGLAALLASLVLKHGHGVGFLRVPLAAGVFLLGLACGLRNYYSGALTSGGVPRVRAAARMALVFLFLAVLVVLAAAFLFWFFTLGLDVPALADTRASIVPPRG